MRLKSRTIVCIVFLVAAVLHIPLWLALLRAPKDTGGAPTEPIPGTYYGDNDDTLGRDAVVNSGEDIGSGGSLDSGEEGGEDDDAPPEGAVPEPPVPTRGPEPPPPQGSFIPMTVIEVVPRAITHAVAVSVVLFTPHVFPDAALEAVYLYTSKKVLFEVVILYGGPLTEITPERKSACSAARRCALLSMQRSGVVMYDANVAEGYDLAMHHSIGANVLFLAGGILPITDMVSEMLATLRMSDNHGAVGCVVASNTSIVSDPDSSSNPYFVVSHGVSVVEGRADVPTFYERMAGFSIKDARVRRDVVVHLLPYQCIFMPRTLYLSLGDFNAKLAVAHSPGLPMYLPHGVEGLYDMMLQIRRRGKRMVVSKAVGALVDLTSWSPLTGYGGMGLELTSLNSEFESKWREFLLQHIAAQDDVHVVWDTFCIKCFGFTNEVMHFIRPLEGLVPLRSKQDYDCFCPGMPVSFTASLRRLAQQKGFEKRLNENKSNVRDVTVWIAHKDPGSFPTSSYDGLFKRPDYVVGRAMYEFTRVPPEWVPHQKDVDEIWVPSRFVYYVFQQNGFDTKKLVIVPEPIDVHYYDPRVVDPLHLPNRDIWRSDSNRPAPELFDATQPPYSLRWNYKFMSVFKWEDRKAWDILLNAYAKAFTSSDAVSLYLYCYLWSGEDARNPTKILKNAISHLKKSLPERDEASLPHIEIVTEQLSEEDMVRAYRSADAFVLPSRGEGWGLPIIQAMAMGLPTIATNWSGQVDFMGNDRVESYALRVDRLENVPRDSSYGWVQGKVWAQPSEEHLRELLQHVFGNREEALAVGRKARSYIVEYFSDEVIARFVRQRLVAIRDVVHAKKGLTGGETGGQEDRHGLLLAL